MTMLTDLALYLGATLGGVAAAAVVVVAAHALLKHTRKAARPDSPGRRGAGPPDAGSVDLFTWVMPAILLKMALGPLLLGRSYAGDGAWAVLVDEFDSPVVGWVSRVVSLLIVLSFLQTLHRWGMPRLARLMEGSGAGRPGPGPLVSQANVRRGGALWWATLGLFVCSVLMPALLSSRPHLSHELLYVTMVATSALLSDARSRVVALERLRWAILLVVGLSLAMAVVLPQVAIDWNYGQGLFGALPRLSGLAPHPVSMSMLALVGIFLLLERPLRGRWAQRAALLLLGVALFLAQSKMTWLAAINGLAMWVMGRSLRAGPAVTELQRSRRRMHLGVAAALASVLALAAPVLATTLWSGMERFLASSAGQSLATGTGRDVIWEVALREWASSPLFGYGLDLFDKEFRTLVGLPFATHGHNQFVDSLARTGVVGTAALVVLLAVIAVQLVRLGPAALSLPGYLFMLLLVRSISEVPWNLQTYGPETIPFIALLVSLRHASDARVTGRRTGPLRLEPATVITGVPLALAAPDGVRPRRGTVLRDATLRARGVADDASTSAPPEPFRRQASTGLPEGT